MQNNDKESGETKWLQKNLTIPQKEEMCPIWLTINVSTMNT